MDNKIFPIVYHKARNKFAKSSKLIYEIPLTLCSNQTYHAPRLIQSQICRPRRIIRIEPIKHCNTSMTLI